MTSPHRNQLLGATALAGALGLVLAAPAWAQTPPPEVSRTNPTPAVGAPGTTNSVESGQNKSPDAPAANNNGESTGVEEVVVTGSRIKRADLTSAQPIQVIGGQYLEEKGFTNVAEALNQLPGIAGSITPTGDQGSFGTGRNFINLFNLGSNRTLTLVNGRRFISDAAASNFSGISAGNQVDTNQIPTAFIDRIETIQAGGSAIYGSDAVAGVINIITKDRFKGLEVDAQYGRSDQDDYPEYRARIAAGLDFLGGRGNAAATFEYNKTDSLLFTDRPRTAANYTFATNPLNVTTTDGIPSSILISNRRIPETNNAGIPFKINTSSLAQLFTITDAQGQVTPAQFGLGGVLVPYQTGQFFSGSVAAGGQGLNLSDVTSLQTPNERFLAAGMASFEITPHIRAHAEFNYTHTDSTEPANQPIYNSALFGGNSGNIAINANTNPFLSAAARTTILAQLPAAANGTFYLSRASSDLTGANNSTTSYSENYRGVLALEGDFTFFNRDFNWNVFYNHGETQGDFSQLQVDQTKFAFAANAITNAAGQPACAPLSATATAAQTASYQGCQPLNFFGVGAPSQAALGYVQAVFSSKFQNKEDNAQANFGGTIWKLPAGNLAFNVGYEYRREESKFSPNLNSFLGIGRSVPISVARGAVEFNELYEEINIPVFGGDFTFPLLQGLELSFSNRDVKNSLAGNGRSYSYQAKYSPIKDLLIRATRSRSFRSPAITELFLPQSSAFATATDPCDTRFINAGSNPAVRAANCQKAFQALGLPANYQLTSTIVAATKMIITGGNPRLKNEIAEQYSYGFVYQPHIIPHLAISADLVNVDLTNSIGSFTLTSILSTCYDQPNQPVDVCSRFSRDNQGQINDNAVTGFVNAGYLHFQGLTATVSYDFEPRYIPGFEGLPGRIGINLQAFNNQRYESSVSGTGLDLVRSAGTIGLPRWTGKLDLSYVNGPFRALVTERYQSTARFDNTFTRENRNILSIDDYFLSDFAVSYKFRNYTARAGVDNVFDVEPPFPSTSTAYDLIGRYYFVGLNARF